MLLVPQATTVHSSAAHVTAKGKSRAGCSQVIEIIRVVHIQYKYVSIPID